MKADEITARDRAELNFTGSIPDGETCRDIAIEATKDGLLVDDTFVITWEWIRSAKAGIVEHPQLSLVPMRH